MDEDATVINSVMQWRKLCQLMTHPYVQFEETGWVGIIQFCHLIDSLRYINLCPGSEELVIGKHAVYPFITNGWNSDPTEHVWF